MIRSVSPVTDTGFQGDGRGYRPLHCSFNDQMYGEVSC